MNELKLREIQSFYPKYNGEKPEEIAPYTVQKKGKLLEEIFSFDGYEKAKNVPVSALAELEKSGLSGRGGANFPTALKWKMVLEIESTEKYVICNIAEGEPGTGKDHALLMNAPRRVVEGIAICSAITGAAKSYIFLRSGYEDAEAGIRAAISDVDCDIELIIGAGGYTCGEETGLIEAVEGDRAEPRLKPPYPGTTGLWGKPTVINNAETFACASLVLQYGAEKFRAYGTEKYPGTRLFTVTGAVEKPGVYELPFGTTLRELYELAGGRAIKGVMSGGCATGTIFSVDKLDIVLTPDAFAADGLSLGTGSIYFIAEDESVPELVRDAVEFLARESCGKCTPCRYGAKRLLELIDGEGTAEGIENLAGYVGANALCGLGQAVPFAVTSAMKYFKAEFEEART